MIIINHIICSDHFYKRCKERLGLNKKASLALLERAYDNGLTFANVRHMSGIRNYMYRICKTTSFNKDRIVRLYNHHVLIIAKDKDTIIGVTIHNIPHNLCPIVDKIYKKKKEEENNGYGGTCPEDEGPNQSS